MAKETFEIIEDVALLRTADTGWTRELSKVSWYHKPTTIDIRWWSPQKRKKQEKGVSLTMEEAQLLLEGLQKMFVY
ncbi:PC4/YdbC family ssDNA-binding protein [Lysinibacillus sp. MHQ-1]|nr:PC4/YdbC family ssDNA-binding protein [Lysinibacillus sp. MHQ-1]